MSADCKQKPTHLDHIVSYTALAVDLESKLIEIEAAMSNAQYSDAIKTALRAALQEAEVI